MNKAYKKISWTQHSQIKMRQYGLSKQKLFGILRNPERVEQGIVPGTTAIMKTNKVFGNKTSSLFGGKTKNPPKADAFRRARAPGEIWLMYKDTKDFRKIISAWRYPGISKPGEEIPIPADIRHELEKNDFE
jgi:hypothetical protein